MRVLVLTRRELGWSRRGMKPRAAPWEQAFHMVALWPPRQWLAMQAQAGSKAVLAACAAAGSMVATIATTQARIVPMRPR